MNNRKPFIITILGCLFFTVACQKILLPQLPAAADVLDGPVEGLTTEQFNAHVQGDLDFGRVFSAADGLGPMYVANSCETCHSGDGKGHPFTSLTRFGKMTPTGFDGMLSEGGPQLQHLAVPSYLPEVLPSGITGMSKFIAPAASGLGFVESVSDADILAWADENDANGDGISGVPSYVDAPAYFHAKSWHIPLNNKYIGRFGRKAGAIDLKHQTVNAFIQDMGVTSDFHIEDLVNPKMGSGDNVPDPEISANGVNGVVFYLQTLKVPPRRNVQNENVKAGEQIFMEIGCGKCHRQSFTTQKVDIQALSEKTFYPYSDFLLHDMGNELNDGYTEGSATTAEWRTTPLWGLGLSVGSQGAKPFYLHDGRARTLTEAIELHGGEGSKSRENFRQLSKDKVESLMAFLESL